MKPRRVPHLVQAPFPSFGHSTCSYTFVATDVKEGMYKSCNQRAAVSRLQHKPIAMVSGVLLLLVNGTAHQRRVGRYCHYRRPTTSEF